MGSIGWYCEGNKNYLTESEIRMRSGRERRTGNSHKFTIILYSITDPNMSEGF